jgi:hypothetical protein
MLVHSLRISITFLSEEVRGNKRLKRTLSADSATRKQMYGVRFQEKTSDKYRDEEADMNKKKLALEFCNRIIQLED